MAKNDVNERASVVAGRSDRWLWGPLVRIYQGGDPGRRRALFLLYGFLGPISVITSYAAVSGPDWRRTAVIKFVVFALVLAWLWRRREPRTWEWMVLAGVAPALSVTVTGLAAHGPGALVPVVGAPIALGVLALVLDGPVLTVALALELAATTIVFFHHFSTPDALLLSLAAVLLLSVEVMVIYGTASYLRRSLAELDAAGREQQRLHAEMALASDRERARIAGELHDDTLQVMTAAVVGLDALGRVADEKTAERAGVIGGQVREAINRTRSLSFDLYPPGMGGGGIGPALEELSRRTGDGAPFRITVDADGAQASQDSERLAFRTIKELIGNAVKHAQPATITISAASRNGHLNCEVRDDGCGFDPNAVVARGDDYHFGLAATAERIRLYGGTFTVDAAPGSGTRVAFSVPVGG